MARKKQLNLFATKPHKQEWGQFVAVLDGLVECPETGGAVLWTRCDECRESVAVKWGKDSRAEQPEAIECMAIKKLTST